jgi:hypothetical protein
MHKMQLSALAFPLRLIAECPGARHARNSQYYYSDRQMKKANLTQSNEQKNQNLTIALSEAQQLIVVAVAILGFAAWLGSSANALSFWPSETDFAAACERNQLKHAYSNYCIDERHIIRVLAPDGTAQKAGFDWNVNNAAVVRAEAAVRYARRAQPGEN